MPKKNSKPRSGTGKCKILWGTETREKDAKVVTDKSWAFTFQTDTLGLVSITVKAGNKNIALDGYSEDLGRLKISQSLLRHRYRYFFHNAFAKDFFTVVSVTVDSRRARQCNGIS